MGWQPTLDAEPKQAEAVLRHLRTLLDEARGVLQAGSPDEQVMLLEEQIEAVRQEAESLVPDFRSEKVRNGVSDG